MIDTKKLKDEVINLVNETKWANLTITIYFARKMKLL